MKLIEKVRETAKVLKTLSRKPRRQPPKRLQARVRATTAMASDEYEEEEPQTKLTSAFVVVLILHIVAVGGIYAFNEIKSSRKAADIGRAAEPAKRTASTATASIKEPDRISESANTIASTVAPASTGVITPAVARPRTYTVKFGDTLHGIAKTYGMNVSDIKAANNLTGDGIRQGQTLTLVLAKVSPTVAPLAPPERVEPAETKVPTKMYTVKSGDRLIFIAKKFSVSQEDLIALNKIKDPAKLQIGQTLKIPSKK
jgi:LysM repeat protein